MNPAVVLNNVIDTLTNTQKTLISNLEDARSQILTLRCDNFMLRKNEENLQQVLIEPLRQALDLPEGFYYQHAIDKVKELQSKQ